MTNKERRKLAEQASWELSSLQSGALSSSGRATAEAKLEQFRKVFRPDVCLADLNRIAELEAENARLLKLLKPFADEAKKWEACKSNPEHTDIDIKHFADNNDTFETAMFNLGDLRRAAQAVKGNE